MVVAVVVTAFVRVVVVKVVGVLEVSAWMCCEGSAEGGAEGGGDDGGGVCVVMVLEVVVVGN